MQRRIGWRRAVGSSLSGYLCRPEPGRPLTGQKSGGLECGVILPSRPAGLDCGDNMIEIMLHNIFKISDEISDEVIVQMQRRCCEENKQWKRRKRREEEVGGFDEGYNERQKKYQRKAKWMKRRIKDADTATLLRAWASI